MQASEALAENPQNFSEVGLRALQRWLFGTERWAWRWWLSDLDAASWERQ